MFVYTLQIRPIHILLLPVALFGGIFVGVFVGGAWLPYVALQEILRRLEDKFDWLRGWTAWSEDIRRPGKTGWLAVWFAWIFLWFASAFTWAWAVGALLGPVAACFVLFVPDGWQRLRKIWDRALDRVRRAKFEFSFDESERPRA